MATPVALTTVFTPAEFCSDVLYTQSTHYHGLTWYKQDALGPGDGSNSACYPPSLSSVWKVIDPSAVMYSPGVCPSGYVTVSPVNNGGHDEPATAICCPGYFTPALLRGCESTIHTPTSTTLVNNASETIITVTRFVAAAFPIVVAWASSDLDLFTPRSAPLALTTSTATRAKDQTTSSTKSASTKAGSGLSTVAIAGTSVGVAIVVLAALAVGVWLFLLRKRKSRNTARELQSYPEVDTGSRQIADNKHEVSPLDAVPPHNVQEIEGSSPHRGEIK